MVSTKNASRAAIKDVAPGASVCDKARHPSRFVTVASEFTRFDDRFRRATVYSIDPSSARRAFVVGKNSKRR